MMVSGKTFKPIGKQGLERVRVAHVRKTMQMMGNVGFRENLENHWGKGFLALCQIKIIINICIRIPETFKPIR